MEVQKEELELAEQLEIGVPYYSVSLSVAAIFC